MNPVQKEIEIKALCRSCGATNRKEQFFEHNTTPADCGFLPKSIGQALGCQSGPIQLSVCKACGLVQNECYDSELIQFKPGYEVSLEFSPTFRKFQAEVVERLFNKFDLQNKTILEIGCGNGSFLDQLCRRGVNFGIGVDPSAPDISPFENITFIQDYFVQEHANTKCDFICSLSAFEDIPNLHSTLSHVHELSKINNAPFYLEVFNGFRTFEQGEIWSLHYEQCNYFSLPSLCNSLFAAGFEIIEASTCYKNDQYLFVEAIAKPKASAGVVEPNADSIAMLNNFPATFNSRKIYWENKLAKDPEQRIILWGSGGKGITFLNSLTNSNRVDAVVDVNPRRQGCFIPGTGHRIISPEELHGFQPDLVVITNAIYRNEISEQLSEMGLRPVIAIA